MAIQNPLQATRGVVMSSSLGWQKFVIGTDPWASGHLWAMLKVLTNGQGVRGSGGQAPGVDRPPG